MVFAIFADTADQADTKAVKVMPFNMRTCFALTTTCFNRAVGVYDEVVPDMLQMWVELLVVAC